MPANKSNRSESLDEIHAENWHVLAEHIQVKVTKRSSDISYLHTKAGFLIAASVVVLQMVGSLPKFTHSVALFALGAAVTLTLLALGLAISSMIISKSASALNIDDMVLQMHKGMMTKTGFNKWLIDSYNVANKEFNKVYSRKYYQQLTSAVILVLAIILVVLLKGFELYV